MNVYAYVSACVRAYVAHEYVSVRVLEYVCTYVSMYVRECVCVCVNLRACECV